MQTSSAFLILNGIEETRLVILKFLYFEEIVKNYIFANQPQFSTHESHHGQSSKPIVNILLFMCSVTVEEERAILTKSQTVFKSCL